MSLKQWAAISLLLTTASFADTVLLNSGESLFGKIVSDTATELSIETPNAAHTIYQTRSILKSQVKSIFLDSSDFASLDPYRPTANAELTIEVCDTGLKALSNFLTLHSDSGYAPEVRHRIDLLNTEKKHLAKGEVKFHQLWMTPKEKADQQRVAEVVSSLQDCSAKRNQAETQRNYLTGVIANIQKEILPLAAKVAALPDNVTYQTMTGRVSRPNSAKHDQQQLLEKLTSRLREKTVELAMLEIKLNDLKSQVKCAQDHYAEIVAAQKSVSRPELNTTPAVAVSQSYPWWKEYWYVIASVIFVSGYFAFRSSNRN